MARGFRKVIGIIVLASILIVLGYWYWFVDMSHLPEGRLQGTYRSPDGTYTINTYLCAGNATNGDAVRAELQTQYGTKNIY